MRWCARFPARHRIVIDPVRDEFSRLPSTDLDLSIHYRQADRRRKADKPVRPFPVPTRHQASRDRSPPSPCHSPNRSWAVRRACRAATLPTSTPGTHSQIGGKRVSHYVPSTQLVSNRFARRAPQTASSQRHASAPGAVRPRVAAPATWSVAAESARPEP